MPDGDSFGGGNYPEPHHTYKVATGEVIIKFRFEDTFPVTMEDEDIHAYIMDNIKDYTDEIVNVENLEVSTHIEQD